MVGLLPDGAEEKEKEASWETWKLDLETGRIGGKIQGAEALKQAVMLRLLTPKYEHMIYGLSYGSKNIKFHVKERVLTVCEVTEYKKEQKSFDK